MTALDIFLNELNKTAVISKEFKDVLYILATNIAQEAYKRGKEEGKKSSKIKSIPVKHQI